MLYGATPTYCTYVPTLLSLCTVAQARVYELPTSRLQTCSSAHPSSLNGTADNSVRPIRVSCPCCTRMHACHGRQSAVHTSVAFRPPTPTTNRREPAKSHLRRQTAPEAYSYLLEYTTYCTSLPFSRERA